MEDEEPFVVERANSPGKLDGRIRLNEGAKHWAREHNMSEEEMAAYLLRQHDRRERGETQKTGRGAAGEGRCADSLPFASAFGTRFPGLGP